jgi:hypothetical protein
VLAHLRAQGPSIGAVGDLDGLLKGPEGIEKIGRVVGRQPVEALSPCSQEIKQVPAVRPCVVRAAVAAKSRKAVP